MQVEHQRDTSQEEVEYAIPSVQNTVHAQDSMKFTQIIAMMVMQLDRVYVQVAMGISVFVYVCSTIISLHIIIAESILRSSHEIFNCKQLTPYN